MVVERTTANANNMNGAHQANLVSFKHTITAVKLFHV